MIIAGLVVEIGKSVKVKLHEKKRLITRLCIGSFASCKLHDKICGATCDPLIDPAFGLNESNYFALARWRQMFFWMCL